MKNKHKTLIAISAILVLLAYGYSASDGRSDPTPAHKGPMIPDPVASATNALTSFGMLVESGLNAVIARNNLLHDEIFKVKFSPPNNPQWSLNEGLEVLSITDPKKMRSYYSHFQNVVNDGQEPTSAWLTFSNSVVGAGTSKQDLLLVISNVNQEACKQISMWADQEIISTEEVSLTPFPEKDKLPTIINLPLQNNQKRYGCVKSAEKMNYYHLLKVF